MNWLQVSKMLISMVPIDTSQIQAKCNFLGNLSQPKTHRPIKVDSRKNASSASIASGAPNTSPINRE